MSTNNNLKANDSLDMAGGNVGGHDQTILSNAMGPKTMSTREFHTNQWSHDADKVHATASKTNLAAPDPYVKFEMGHDGRIRETSDPNVYVDDAGLNKPSPRVSDRESLRPLRGDADLVAGATDEQLASVAEKLKAAGKAPPTAAHTNTTPKLSPNVNMEPSASIKANANPIATASTPASSMQPASAHAVAAGASQKLINESPNKVALDDAAKSTPAGQQHVTTTALPTTAKPGTLPKAAAAPSAAASTAQKPAAAPHAAQASPQQMVPSAKPAQPQSPGSHQQSPPAAAGGKR